MTKEELKGQIREIVREWWYCAEHIFPSILVDKLTDFAEPREKRIAELEKENAELKEKINIRSCQNCKHNNKSCPNDGSCKNYSKWQGYRNLQLTKAKEIINDCVCELQNILFYKMRNKERIASTLDKAEQFLKDT